MEIEALEAILMDDFKGLWCPFFSESESQFLRLYFRIAILTCNAASFCGRNSLW